MALDITVDDLTPFATIDDAKAEAMIEDALAMAELVAPCIVDTEFAYTGAAKAILRGAILRWHDTGSGSATQQVVGPFQQNVTPQPRKSLFWPSEIEQLQSLCRATQVNRAYEVDLTPAGAGLPAEWCGWDIPPPDGAGPTL